MRPRAWSFRYCVNHQEALKRYGHPDGRKLFRRDLEPFLTYARRLHAETWRTWPGWRAAEDVLEAILREPERTGFVGPEQRWLWRAFVDRHRNLKKLPTRKRQRIRLRHVLYALIAVWCLERFGFKELPPSDLAVTRQLGVQLLTRTAGRLGRVYRTERHVGQGREIAGQIVRKHLGLFLESVTDEIERRLKERQRESLRQGSRQAS